MGMDRFFTLEDGRTLHYVEMGDPGGRPLLYLHGGLSCSLDISFADEFCRERGIRIIAPNRPGILHSTRLPGLSFSDTTSDLYQLIDSLEIDDPALLGWSAGGVHALYAAYSMPGRFARTVSIGAPSDLNSRGLFTGAIRRATRTSRIPMVAAADLLNLMPSFIQRVQTEYVAGLSADRQVLKEMQPSIDQLYKGAMRQGGQGVTDEFMLLSSEWPQVETGHPASVFLMHGSEDQIVPLPNALRLSQIFTGAKIIEVEGEGHFLHHRSMDMVCRLLEL